MRRSVFTRRGPLAGVPRRSSKFGSAATYFDGKTLHSSGIRGCPGVPLCPYCTQRPQHDPGLWYPSRAEALHAERLLKSQQDGLIRGWRRCRHGVLLVDAPVASDRVRYRPDFDVWVTSDPEHDPPDKRIEVKGGIKGVAYSGKLKIRLYREAVRRGEQPPLEVVDGEGKALDV